MGGLDRVREDEGKNQKIIVLLHFFCGYVLVSACPKQNSQLIRLPLFLGQHKMNVDEQHHWSGT